eukprot:CAMPEP_0175146952 /NCGR_PEP_ID=MMETSP0087-20121206/15683_1 /TAXON_ID=136419 /ORGANISM="Unknown Unknown, Strain D1" /LENGTH=671 /DNA_ID=CAMNT_0016432009 /DNA_START=45 /DNA_END=2060 /DNA_ORIENTATION=-
MNVCQFHLFSGENTTLQVNSWDTFQDIRDKIWKKKTFPELSKPDYLFRMTYAELYFDLSDTFQQVLDVLPLFGKTGVIELSLIPHGDVGDSWKRDKLQVSSVGKISMQSVLSKVGSGKTQSLVLRFYVLQDNTMLIYDTKADFDAKKPANRYIPMGSCSAKACEPPVMKNFNKAFNIAKSVGAQGLEKFGNRDSVLPLNNKAPARKYYFQLNATCVQQRLFEMAAETEADRDAWVAKISQLNMNRMKVIVLMCVRELRKRKCFDTEGIFRVSGSKDEMALVRREFDYGRTPDLGAVENVHNITGLLKQSLRDVSTPLLTYELYDHFLDIGDKPFSLPSLVQVANQLPANCKGFARFLFQFLSDVAQFSEESKMTPANLAIVFAPNLLYPKHDDPLANMQNIPKINKAVEYMIISATELFHEGLDESKHSGPPSRPTSRSPPPYPAKPSLPRTSTNPLAKSTTPTPPALPSQRHSYDFPTSSASLASASVSASFTSAATPPPFPQHHTFPGRGAPSSAPTSTSAQTPPAIPTFRTMPPPRPNADVAGRPPPPLPPDDMDDDELPPPVPAFDVSPSYYMEKSSESRLESLIVRHEKCQQEWQKALVQKQKELDLQWRKSIETVRKLKGGDGEDAVSWLEELLAMEQEWANAASGPLVRLEDMIKLLREVNPES